MKTEFKNTENKALRKTAVIFQLRILKLNFMKNKDCVCTEICLNPENCLIKPRK